MSQSPIIKLFRNPWSATLVDGVVLQILQTAAINAAARLQAMITAGEVEDGRDSFGAVLINPTNPRSALTFADCVLATIEIGPNAAKYLPNGAAKADAHDRHGFPNGGLVGRSSYCLGNGDFAWGNSAAYSHPLGGGIAIGGGSGLSVQQDGDMVYGILKEVMDQVRSRRDPWIAEQRHGGKSHGWYNPANEPGPEYKAILTMEPIASIGGP